MSTLRKPFQDYLQEVFPDRQLSVQQSAAVGRWLRKQGFNIAKEFDNKFQKTISMIVYDSHKKLPTHCDVRISDHVVMKPLRPPQAKASTNPEPERPAVILRKAAPPENLREAIKLIGELYSIIELLAEELEVERATNRAPLPEPSEKVKQVMAKFNVGSDNK